VAAVAWSEQLKGWCSSTETDFNQALREGKAAQRSMRAELSLEIADIDQFVRSEPKRAQVTSGTVSCPALGGDLEIEWGVFELLVPGSEPPDHLHLRMRYRLNLRGPVGEPLGLRGFKVVENDPGYDSWADTSTLFVRIYNGRWDPNADPAALVGQRDRDRPADAGEFLGAQQLEDDDALAARDPKLVATAVIAISVGAFAGELLTFTGTGRTPGARLAGVMRYGACFAEGLVKAYGGTPVSDGCASFPRDYQRAPSSAGGEQVQPSPVPGRDRPEWLEPREAEEPRRARYALERLIVPFHVDDLAFPLNLHHITAVEAAGDGPYPEAPGSRGPVLLVHGAGVRAEMFYGQPLGETVVDFLLGEGYDVWIENWRASIDLPNNSYTLDRAAKFDHPAAVKMVMERTEQTRGDHALRALVHCQGSVSFVMAAVAGYLRKWPISHVVSTTISLFFDVPFKTWLKQRAMLPISGLFGTGADPQWGIRAPTPSGRALAWLSRWTEPECGNAACQIANYIYGSGPDVLLRHSNVAQPVHDWTSRELGYSPFSLIAQVAESCKYGNLVPAQADRSWAPPSYVAHEPLVDGTRFTFLGAGGDRMFLASGQKRTADFFNGFDPTPEAEYVCVEGYGHMDIYWGERAPREVFPVIGAGLADGARGWPAAGMEV
jgi:hypothetical protein